MKIGLVLPSVPGYSETFFRSKISGLQANGFEVVLFVNKNDTKTDLSCKIVEAPQFSKNTLKSGVFSLYYLLKVLFFNFKQSKKLYQLDQKDGLHFTKRIKSIVINSHLLSQKLDWLHFGFGTMALERENVAAAIGAKMAVSFRGFDYYVYPIKNSNCYEKLYSKKVKYHVLSEGMKSGLIDKGILEKNIIKITPALDLNLFTAVDKNQSEIIQIKTIARLHWIKGLDYTLETLAILKSQGFNFHYTIIGDGIEKERLLFAVHQLGLSKNVTFTGKLSPQKIINELETAAIYLQYSIQEGFCNAVLEAQAMGLLCIVSDAEGLQENVLDAETGFVVPKRNPEILANKIIEVIHLSEEEKEKIISNAVNRVKTTFTIEKQIKQFIDFYTNY